MDVRQYFWSRKHGIRVKGLGDNTVGNDNVLLKGCTSLFNRRKNNSAIGTYSMYDNTTGANNTAIGFRALENNTTEE